MILTTTRHGRTRRDICNLKTHLDKSMGQVARVVEIGNCPVGNADDALAYMEAMRDGSLAEVSCHHVVIAPAIRLQVEGRDEAVRRILSAFGAEDHPFILWEHDKYEALNGCSAQHFHLIIGHVGNDLKALDDSRSFVRLEAVARTMEVDFGEPLTVSRRTAAVASELRRIGRADVADMLVEPSHLPRSSMSAKTRAAADRAGINLPAARAAVEAAWAASDTQEAFRSALAEKGLSVAMGAKQGVYVVKSGEVTLGALDRLAKQKRGVVAALMKGFEYDDGTKTSAHRNAGDREGLPPEQRCEGRGREARAFASTHRPDAERGTVADRATAGDTGGDPQGTAPSAPVDGGVARKVGWTDPLAQARLNTSLAGFSISTEIAAEMHLVKVRAFEPRGLSVRLLARELIPVDWKRLLYLADSLLDFVHATRRRIQFGHVELPMRDRGPQLAPLSTTEFDETPSPSFGW